MAFPATAAGRRFGPASWEASERRILAFRAAIAPEDARGFTPRNDEPLSAAPTHAASVEWFLTTSILQSLAGLGLTAAEAERGVVVGQDTEFHAPVLAGERLSIDAQIVGVRPVRSGALVSTVFETRGGADNHLKARTVATTIYRDVACVEAGQTPPANRLEALQGGTELPLSLPYGFAHVFSECAEIWNPIHTEHAVARRAGLDVPIVHGVALWAMVGRLLCEHAADGAEQRLKSLSARFMEPTPLGASLTFSYAINDESRAVYTLRLHDGAVAVAGEAQLSPENG